MIPVKIKNDFTAGDSVETAVYEVKIFGLTVFRKESTSIDTGKAESKAVGFNPLPDLRQYVEGEE